MSVAAPHPSPIDGSIFIASPAPAAATITRLRPVPLAAQARLLAATGEFTGALELCARLPPSPKRRDLEDSLRLRFCHNLFEAGDVDDALTQLSMCSDAGPLLLLRLFPGLVPGKFRGLLPTSAYGEGLPEIEDGGDQDGVAGVCLITVQMCIIVCGVCGVCGVVLLVLALQRCTCGVLQGLFPGLVPGKFRGLGLPMGAYGSRLPGIKDEGHHDGIAGKPIGAADVRVPQCGAPVLFAVLLCGFSDVCLWYASGAVSGVSPRRRFRRSLPTSVYGSRLPGIKYKGHQDGIAGERIGAAGACDGIAAHCVLFSPGRKRLSCGASRCAPVVAWSGVF